MMNKLQNSTQASISRARPRFLKVGFVIASLGLAACGGPTDFNKQLSDRNGFVKPSPVNEVTETPFSHAIALQPSQAGLSNRQNASLSGFLAQTGRDRGDHYEIRTAYTAPDQVIAGRNSKIAQDLRRSFVSQGVQADRIQLVHVPGFDNTLELVVRRYSIISPACGVIDVNLGHEWEDEPVQNRDLGCANAYNLGQMIADPRDLVGGRPFDPASGEREAIGARQHGLGTIPELNTEETSTTGD